MEARSRPLTKRSAKSRFVRNVGPIAVAGAAVLLGATGGCSPGALARMEAPPLGPCGDAVEAHAIARRPYDAHALCNYFAAAEGTRLLGGDPTKGGDARNVCTSKRIRCLDDARARRSDAPSFVANRLCTAYSRRCHGLSLAQFQSFLDETLAGAKRFAADEDVCDHLERLVAEFTCATPLLAKGPGTDAVRAQCDGIVPTCPGASTPALK